MRARAAPYLSACSRTAVAARWPGGRRRAAAQVGGGRARRPSGGMGLDAAVAAKCRHRRGPAGPVVRVVGRGARRGWRAHRWRAGGAPRLTSAAGLVRSRRTRGPTNGQEGGGRSTGDRPPLRPVPPCWSPVLFSDPEAPLNRGRGKGSWRACTRGAERGVTAWRRRMALLYRYGRVCTARVSTRRGRRPVAGTARAAAPAG